jgi:23S rRNA (guanosine2251-2'-O)-methyltransferase
MEKLEGRQSILAALVARKRKIQLLLMKSNSNLKKNQDVLDMAKNQGIPIKIISEQEMDSAAQGKTHGGLMAICTPKPVVPTQDLFKIIAESKKQPFLFLLEGVEDGQNLAFILRTAWAMGAAALLLKKHVWNFDTLAVSRASAGAYELLPMVKIEKEADELGQIKKQGIQIFGAIAGAKKTLYDMNFKAPVLVALGGEKRGLSAVTRSACDGFFSIPMLRNELFLEEECELESISLSHSAAIIMGEIMRQRQYS